MTPTRLLLSRANSKAEFAGSQVDMTRHAPTIEFFEKLTMEPESLLNADCADLDIDLDIDLGAADRVSESAYRRGYHQAVADISDRLRFGRPLNALELVEWVEGAGKRWRHVAPLTRHILPPKM